MTIYTLALAGDSISYRIASFWYQYFGVPSTLEPGNNTVGSTGPQRGQFRPFKASPKIIGVNYAISGTRLTSNPDNMTAVAATTVDLLIPAVKANPIAGTGTGGVAGEARKYISILHAGTNPDTSDPAVHLANVAAYCAARKNVVVGFDYFLVCTLQSRTDGIIANFDTTYQSVINTSLRSSVWRASNNIDGCIDTARNALIGGAAAADNATYFSDKIHPTAAGDALMGTDFATDMDAFIAAH